MASLAIAMEDEVPLTDEARSRRHGRRRSYTILSPNSSSDNVPPGDIDSLQHEMELEQEACGISSPVPEWANKLCIWMGDPSCLAVDALIRSAGPNLITTNRGESFWAPAVERAGISRLLLSCETYLQRQNTSSLSAGHVLVTPAFELPCKYILHVVTPSADRSNPSETLERYYKVALEKAVAENFKTLAMPLLGDEESFTLDQSVSAMKSVLTNTELLSEIDRIVIAHDNELELDFIRLSFSGGV